MIQNWLVILLIGIILTGCSPQQPEEQTQQSVQYSKTTENTAEKELSFDGYQKIEVDGGDLNGHREANAAVDIGFEDREYWAFTNEHGQLVRVVADKIILQDDKAEPVKSSGRYYDGQAKVPGPELKLFRLYLQT